ncbi:hypothetical protein BDR26DRAFT_864440 [Obelidium mucronatum]|nr:hypothetical protein BDR26DRAFT_864440 [Obelidium mucronatum]
MWDRNKYGYYFQTYALTGLADSIGLLLRKWNVGRVALVDTTPFSNPSSHCGYISQYLENQNFHIVARVVLDNSLDLDFLTKSLAQADARYIILCAGVDESASIYFGMAHRKQFVGPEYVWILENIPFSSENAVELWGPDYYKNARGIINTFGANPSNPSIDQFSRLTIESWFNIVQMHECPRIFAHGLDNLLKSRPNTPQIQRDPLQLTPNGDIATSYEITYCDGKTDAITAIPFAITDTHVTTIAYRNGTLPIFFDGTSTPPLDGPIYTTLFIRSDGFDASLLKAFAGVGLFFGIGFFLVVQRFQKAGSIRQGSVTFLSILALGSVPSHVSNLFYIGIPSTFKCQVILWLQLCSFAIMSAAVIFKNLRVTLIYTAQYKLPKYMVADLFWVLATCGVVLVEMILLGVWTIYSKPIISKKFLPGYIIELKCEYTSHNSDALSTALWIYNILILASMYIVAYKSHNMPAIHSEATFLLLVSLCLTISCVLAGIMGRNDPVDYSIKIAVLVFLNTTIVLLLQAVPRVWSLLNTDIFGGSHKTLSKLKWLSQLSSDRKESQKRTGNSQKQQQQQRTAGFSFAHDAIVAIGAKSYFLNVTPSNWVRCVISYNLVRKNVYLMCHPSRYDVESNPIVIPISGSLALNMKLTVLMNGKTSFERLEIENGKKVIVIDFVKVGDGGVFKSGLISTIDGGQNNKEVVAGKK